MTQHIERHRFRPISLPDGIHRKSQQQRYSRAHPLDRAPFPKPSLHVNRGAARGASLPPLSRPHILVGWVVRDGGIVQSRFTKACSRADFEFGTVADGRASRFVIAITVVCLHAVRVCDWRATWLAVAFRFRRRRIWPFYWLHFVRGLPWPRRVGRACRQWFACRLLWCGGRGIWRIRRRTCQRRPLRPP